MTAISTFRLYRNSANLYISAKQVSLIYKYEQQQQKIMKKYCLSISLSIYLSIKFYPNTETPLPLYNHCSEEENHFY